MPSPTTALKILPINKKVGNQIACRRFALYYKRKLENLKIPPMLYQHDHKSFLSLKLCLLLYMSPYDLNEENFKKST